MGFAFAYTPSSTCSNLPNLNLQSRSLFAAFISKQCLSLRNPTKRIRKRSPIIRAQAQNGAVVTSEKPETNYGRQYFPLAAVVGQVIIN